MEICDICNQRFQDSQALVQHQKATRHCYCNHCDRGFPYLKTLDQHNLALHSWSCGDCNGKFITRENLRRHQRFTNHCYCGSCDRVFGDENALRSHLRSSLHLRVSEFRCCDCDQGFVDERALNQHLSNKIHHTKRAQDSRPPFACPKCTREFMTQDALKQHKSSLVHKPISNLKCLAGKMGESRCERNFSSPSAMIQHLESGACPSGLNRQKLNEALEMHDTENIITAPEDNNLLKYGIEDLTLDTEAWSSDQSTVFTPDSDSNSNTEQSLLVALTTRCPLCPVGSRQFATLESLQQHLNSPVHSPKLFRCPVSLAPESSSKSLLRMSFTTLSGLAQHLESGACAGGRATFEKAAEYIEAKLENMGMKKVKWLI